MIKRKKTIPEQVAAQLMDYFQEDWQTLFADGEALQDAVLAEILALSKDSAYAKAHGFAGIQTWEAFQEKVHISEYADYSSHIDANMKKDNGQLIDLETAYYLSTTGTTGSVKYFAESEIGALARQLVIDIWNLALSKAVPQFGDPHVKMLAVVNCSSVDYAKNGKKIIRASGQAGKVLWERAAQHYVFPYAFLEAIIADEDRDYLTALYTLKEAGFSMLFCNNLAYFGVLLDAIAKHSQQMIDDIRTGQMTANLQDGDREILRDSFLPDVKRAADLQQLLDQYGFLPIEKIWTNFSFIGTWLSGSAGRMAKAVQQRLPETIQYISEGYGASEAMLTIPMQFDCAYGACAPFAYYYEFLPLGAEKTLRMSEVVDGEFYELIITTYSGLFRYNLHDIVRIRGFTGTTVNLEFCCKSTEKCAIGDKTVYGFQLAEIIRQVEERMGHSMNFYQGFSQQGQLAVVVQPDEAGFDAKTFFGYLQESMATCDLICGKLYVVNRNYRDQLFREQMHNGRMMHSIKLLTMIAEPPKADLIEIVYEA